MSENVKVRSVHIDDATWERAKSTAADCGLSVSGLIRLLLNLEIPKPIPAKEWRAVYMELSAIGNNINQMAKLAHINNNADYTDFADDVKVIYELRDEITKRAILPAKIYEEE